MRTSKCSPALTHDDKKDQPMAYTNPTLEAVRDSKEVKNELLAQMHEDAFNRGSSMNTKKPLRGELKDTSADYSLDFDEDTTSDNRSGMKAKGQRQESKLAPKLNMLDLNKLKDAPLRKYQEEMHLLGLGSQDNMYDYLTGDLATYLVDPRELDLILQGYRRN